MKCLDMLFVHFQTGLSVISLLAFEGSLYGLDTNPLTNMWFSNIFSQCVASLLFSFPDLLWVKVFIDVITFV